MSNVIYKAILSEKAYAQMEHGIYTFVVNSASHKNDVKKAVETQFMTKVSSVRLLGFPSKVKRVTGTRKTTEVGGGKKAIVVLEKGQKIAMLSPKAESKNQRAKESKKETIKTSEPDNPKGAGLLSKIRRASKANDKEDAK